MTTNQVCLRAQQLLCICIEISYPFIVDLSTGALPFSYDAVFAALRASASTTGRIALALVHFDDHKRLPLDGYKNLLLSRILSQGYSDHNRAHASLSAMGEDGDGSRVATTISTRNIAGQLDNFLRARTPTILLYNRNA